MHPVQQQEHRSRFYPLQGLGSLLLAALLVWIGCDSNDAVEEEPEFVEVVILLDRDSVSLEVGEQFDFSSGAITASGDTVQDHNLDVRWWSTDTTVFTVDNNGVATGQNPGRGHCMVEITDQVANTSVNSKAVAPKFVGRDSLVVHVF